MEHKEQPTVVLCNSAYDRESKDDVKTLEVELEKYTNLVTIKSFEIPYEFLETNLPRCDVGILTVPHSTIHVEGMIALTEEWHRKEKQLRKIIPIYSSQQQYDRLTHFPVFLRTDPLIMRQNKGDDDLSAFKQQMFKTLTNLRSQMMDYLYPVGDVCKGLAINYITLFDRILSPEMDEEYKLQCKALEKATVAGITKHRVDKTIIAVPISCTCQYHLKAYGEQFAHPMTLTVLVDKMHGLDRPMNLSMYELQKGSNVYMTRVEVPNIVTTLSKVTQKDGKPAQGAINFEGVARLSPEQMPIQREGFVNEIRQLIDIYHKDEYLIVPFDESKQDLAERIIDKIEKDLANPRSEKEAERKPCAFVIYDEEKDRDSAKAFEQELAKRDVDILDFTDPSVREPEAAVSKLNFKEATAFFWIRDGKLSDKQRYTKQNYLWHQTNNNFRQLVPVIVDDAEKVDDSYLQGVVPRRYRAPGQPGHDDFIHDAYKLCISKKPLTYPMGEVYKGLCWAASLNYMLPVMPGKVNFMKEKVVEELKANHPGAKFFTKQIHLVEDHCRDTGGTVIYVTLKFKDTDLTKDQKKIVAGRVKETVKKFLQIDDRQLEVKSIDAVEGRSVAPVKVTILRKHPDHETYDPSLRKMAIDLADHVANKTLEIDLGHGVKVVANKADIAGKSFEEFEGIEIGVKKLYQVADASTGIIKPIFLYVNLITYNGQKYIAGFEYVRAITCLGEIHSADLIPLAMSQMKEQVDSFVHLYHDKAERNIKEIRDTCALLRYDGDEQKNRTNNELHLGKIIAEFIEANLDDVITL